MPRRWLACLGLAMCALLVAVAGASAQMASLPPSVASEATTPLSSGPTRVGLFAGAFYGGVSGSQIQHTDPGVGFEIGGSYRVYRDISVWGAFARSSFDVSGQVTELLDHRILDSGRSATVDGSLKFTRFRLGARLDGLREPSFRFQPYLVGAVIFTKNEASLDTVDGGAPPHPSTSDSKIGGYGRFGVGYRVAPFVDVDGYVGYETFQFPTSTNSQLCLGAGLRLRR